MPEGEDQPLSHNRNLAEFLERIGITDARKGEAAELRRFIQMEVPVDDARHLVRPITVPVAVFNLYVGPVVGLHSTAQLVCASRNGLYVIDLMATSNGMRCATEGLQVFTPGALMNPGMRGGDKAALGSEVRPGTIPAPATNPVAMPLNQSLGFLPFYMAPGDVLHVYNNVVNTSISGHICVQEIP